MDPSQASPNAELFGRSSLWAYCIFFFLGLGNLFPWNSFITASYYFSDRFCGSAFEGSFENYFTVSFTVCQTLGLALTILFCENWAIDTKVMYPLTLYSLVFLATTMMVGIYIEATYFFEITIILTCISGLCGSLLSAGIFGMAAYFPGEFTGALMNGQGLAGLTVSLSSLLTSAAGDEVDICDDDNANMENDDNSCKFHVSYSAMVYFGIATVVLALNIVSYIYLKKLKITKHYVDKFDNASDSSFAALEIDKSKKRGGGSLKNQLRSNLLITDIDGVAIPNSNVGDFDSFNSFDKEQMRKSEIMDTDGTVMAILKSIWIPALSVFLAFMVTIGVFPSLFVLIESEKQCDDDTSRFYNDLFIPFLFLIFNIFDFIGRVCAEKFKSLLNSKSILPFACLRFLFIPLFLLCNLSNNGLPVAFKSDFFPIFIDALFALTNGYLASSAMMLGPQLVSAKDSGVAGTIMIFCLTLGLFAGGCLSFLVVYISQG